MLPTIFSSRHLPLYLMMKKEDASATLAPMWQRKRGFTHAGAHTYSRQYIEEKILREAEDTFVHCTAVLALLSALILVNN